MSISTLVMILYLTNFYLFIFFFHFLFFKVQSKPNICLILYNQLSLLYDKHLLGKKNKENILYILPFSYIWSDIQKRISRKLYKFVYLLWMYGAVQKTGKEKIKYKQLLWKQTPFCHFHVLWEGFQSCPHPF